MQAYAGGGLGRGKIASVAKTWAAVGSRAVEATERMCQNPGWPQSKASGVVLDLPILCSSSSAR